MIPDGVIGDAGVGREQRPELAQRAVVRFLDELGAEAPEGEQRALPVDHLAFLDDEPFEMAAAPALDVVEVGVGEGAQVELLAVQRVDQGGLPGPAHLCPFGDCEGPRPPVPSRNSGLFHRPLRTVGGRRPPVRPLDRPVHAGGDSVLGEHGVEGVFAVRRYLPRLLDAVEAEQPMQRPRRASLVAGRVAQEHQRLLGRIVQAGVQLGLPERVVGHDRHSGLCSRVSLSRLGFSSRK